MLRTRVATAVVVLIVVVGFLFLGSREAWSLFMLAVALAAAWEWSRLCGLASGGRAVYLAASGALGGFLWSAAIGMEPQAFTRLALAAFAAASLFWIVIAPLWLRRRLRPAPAWSAAAGWLAVWPTWCAFVVLRDLGPWVLLAVAAVVWVADIAAYFAGRRFGRRKLAPAISPGKTWEGVYGALAGVVVYGIALDFAAHATALPLTPLFRPAWGVPALFAMLALAALSVVGDLFESWMKRGAGLKDSSALLPGHGGVLDRIDALTSTLPAAALAIALAGAASPAP